MQEWAGTSRLEDGTVIFRSKLHGGPLEDDCWTSPLVGALRLPILGLALAGTPDLGPGTRRLLKPRKPHCRPERHQLDTTCTSNLAVTECENARTGSCQ